MAHVNAKDIYPPDLVKEIQKHYSGGYLWIPKAGNIETGKTSDKEGMKYERAKGTISDSR